MARNQFVILKGRRDGIHVWLDEHAEFETLLDELRTKVTGAKHFFADANTNIAFKGRKLSEDEEKALLDIIIDETTLELSFVEHGEIIEEEKAEPPQIRSAEKSTALPRTEYPEATYWNGLRSGQSIRYAGSVIVLGDVNPGSEIVADGNIIVMGKIMGMVHAGASGDDRCFVSALSLTPIQLRIANTITHIPSDQRSGRKQTCRPVYAYIQNSQVYIAPLWD